MKNFKSWCIAILVLGLFFIVLGWWYSLPYPVSSDIAENVFMHRAIKTWFFFSMGITFILISILLNALINKFQREMKALAERIHQLEQIK